MGWCDCRRIGERIDELEAENERLKDALREIANRCSTSRERLEVAMTALDRAEDDTDRPTRAEVERTVDYLYRSHSVQV